MPSGSNVVHLCEWAGQNEQVSAESDMLGWHCNIVISLNGAAYLDAG